MSRLGRLVATFASRDQAERDDDARVLAVPGTVALGDLAPRRRARVAGVISSITRSVPGTSPRIDLTVTDGNHTVAARFLGQREVPGLFPGRVVVLDGSFCSERGGLVVFNPAYELLVRPELEH